MSSSSTFFLASGKEQVSVVVHEPQSRRHATAVLISPPFGWPEVASYRIRRTWASELARDGHVTMRLTLPSTGDSSGAPADPARLSAWGRALAAGADWLRDRAGAGRVAVIGVELGGLVALAALAEGAPIDDLVLWATPGKGRTLARELRAFSLIEAEQFFEDERQPSPPAGELQVGGFLLSAETIAVLERFDVESLQSRSWPQRALLLERDGIAPNATLHRRLVEADVAVTVAPGDGYAAMTNHPQQAHIPEAVFEQVARWLAHVPQADPGSSAPPAAPAQHGGDGRSEAIITLPDGATISERTFVLEQPFGELIGILAEPAEPYEPGLCIGLLNAGAIRRIGPGRMWVEIARRWAARGVPVLRLDLQGIGDGDGTSDYSHDRALYVPGFVDQVIAALDVLERRGVGASFLLAGLCSGAYWSLHAALADERVVAASLLNPRALLWNESVMPSRDFKRLARIRGEWHKVAEVPRSRYWGLARWLAAAPARGVARGASRAAGRRAPDQVAHALDRVRDADKPLLLLFSEQEPLHQELTKSGHLAQLDRWPNITLELIEGRDHTLRPFVSQREAHQAFDRSVQRVLASGRVSHPRGPSGSVPAGRG